MNCHTFMKEYVKVITLEDDIIKAPENKLPHGLPKFWEVWTIMHY